MPRLHRQEGGMNQRGAMSSAKQHDSHLPSRYPDPSVPPRTVHQGGPRSGPTAVKQEQTQGPPNSRRGERSSSAENSNRLRTQLEEQFARYGDLLREYEGHQAERLQSRSDSNARLRKDVERLMRENGALRQDRDAWKGMFEVLARTKAAPRAVEERLQRRAEAAEEEVGTLRESSRRRAVEQASAEALITAVSAERDALQAESQAGLARLREAEKAKAELDVRMLINETQLRDVERRLTDQQAESARLQLTAVALESENAVLGDALKRKWGECEALHSHVNRSDAQLARLRHQMTSTDTDITAPRPSDSRLEARLAILGEENDRLQVDRDEWIAEATRQSRKAQRQVEVNAGLETMIDLERRRADEAVAGKERVVAELEQLRAAAKGLEGGG